MADSIISQLSAEEIAFLATQPSNYVFPPGDPIPPASTLQGPVSPEAPVDAPSSRPAQTAFLDDDVVDVSFDPLPAREPDAPLVGSNFTLADHEQFSGFSQQAFVESEIPPFTFGSLTGGSGWQPDPHHALWDMLLG